MTDYGIFASGAQAHRIEVKLDAVLQLLGVERTETHLILKQGLLLMANIDDIEADEAALKDTSVKLINLMGQALVAIAALKNNPGVPADVQTKIDDVHAKLVQDLNDITAAVSTDGAALNPADPAQLQPSFITGVDPTSGPAGTVVTLTGRDFVGVTGVTVGGVPAVVFSVPDAQTVSVTIPDGAPVGDTSIVVTDPQGNSNAGAFSVTASVAVPPAPPVDAPVVKP